MGEQAAKSKAHIFEMMQTLENEQQLVSLEEMTEGVMGQHIPADLEAYLSSDACMEDCYQALQRMKAGEYFTMEEFMEAGRRGAEEGLKARRLRGLDD